MHELKKHELDIEVIHRKGPDRFKRHWRTFQYFGRPVPPYTWPSGENAIIYFYFLLDESGDRLSVFRPDDLIYMGERAVVSNFKNGWVIPERTQDKDFRYPWMHHYQGRRFRVVAYELPASGKYTCELHDKLHPVCKAKRRSVECFVMLDLLKRHGARTEIFRHAKGFTLRVRWLRSGDVIEDAKSILKDLRSSYGL